MKLFPQTAHRQMQALGLVTVASLLGACQTNPDLAERTTYGAPVAFGAGTARTYFVQDAQGMPVSLGIEISESTLSGLPHEMLILPLELPAAARDMQYSFVMLDWMPHGHDPESIYTHPHFDFHFYMAPFEQVSAVVGGPDPVVVAPHFLPVDYISPGNIAIPAMGVHWVDKKSPEFNGKIFDKTFMYGASAGEITFLEPMVTLEFLATKPDFSESVAQPEAVQREGYYPQRYSVRYLDDRKTYRVSLDDLVRREPAGQPS